MNEDIIKWAREAGFSDHSNPEMWGYMIASDEEIARFAALVAAAERAECVKSASMLAHALVLAERENCAKVCDDMAAQDNLTNYYKVAARAIRERKS
jgi:hypothetical protein